MYFTGLPNCPSMKKYSPALLFTSLVMIVVIHTGCYYNTEEELYGTSCDTINVKYSTTINGLLSTYGCYGCHSGPGAISNLRLDSHLALSSNINRVWGAINHVSGFVPMPDGGGKMSDCDRKKIKAWMDAGMPNN